MPDCTVEHRQAHRALAATVAADPRVAAVDVIEPAATPSGEWTTEIVLAPGEPRVPPTLLGRSVTAAWASST